LTDRKLRVEPTSASSDTWPIELADVMSARDRIRKYLSPTALRQYAPLDEAVGRDIHVLVKHENHNPTNSFKVRNALSAMTVLSVDERRRGVVAGTAGNHGQGLAYAGRVLGIPVTLCVPQSCNAEKNASMRGYGATVIEDGDDYDDAVANAERLVREQGLVLIHSTNNREILAGAGTITLEILEQEDELDAIVVAVGGGSQAVGAMTVLRARAPSVQVYGVQANGAAAIHDSWRARHPGQRPFARTFADGIATRSTYAMTFDALCAGLVDFVTVSEAEIATALRLLLRTTHNLAEGAGAAGLAGLFKLREKLAGQRVAVVLSGGNVDEPTLRRIVLEQL
jgi:threonine dehydratase